MDIHHVKFGAPQRCPKCYCENSSGLFLPEQCKWCHGTGKVDIGIKLDNKKIRLIKKQGIEKKMKLDPDRFVKDERFSNHAVQGYSHPDCSIDKGCFAQATGFGGGIVSLCDKFNKKTCECSEIVIRSFISDAKEPEQAS